MGKACQYCGKKLRHLVPCNEEESQQCLERQRHDYDTLQERDMDREDWDGK